MQSKHFPSRRTAASGARGVIFRALGVLVVFAGWAALSSATDCDDLETAAKVVARAQKVVADDDYEIKALKDRPLPPKPPGSKEDVEKRIAAIQEPGERLRAANKSLSDFDRGENKGTKLDALNAAIQALQADVDAAAKVIAAAKPDAVAALEEKRADLAQNEKRLAVIKRLLDAGGTRGENLDKEQKSQLTREQEDIERNLPGLKAAVEEKMKALRLTEDQEQRIRELPEKRAQLRAKQDEAKPLEAERKQLAAAAKEAKNDADKAPTADLKDLQAQLDKWGEYEDGPNVRAKQVEILNSERDAHIRAVQQAQADYDAKKADIEAQGQAAVSRARTEASLPTIENKFLHPDKKMLADAKARVKETKSFQKDLKDVREAMQKAVGADAKKAVKKEWEKHTKTLVENQLKIMEGERLDKIRDGLEPACSDAVKQFKEEINKAIRDKLGLARASLDPTDPLDDGANLPDEFAIALDDDGPALIGAATFIVKPGAWKHTGVQLKKGQVIHITATGSLNWPGKENEPWKPDGYTEAVGPGSYALHAKLGENNLAIGAHSGIIIVDADAELLLGIPHLYEPGPEDAKIQGAFAATVTGDGVVAASGASGGGAPAGGGDPAAAPIMFRVACPVLLEVTDAQGRRASMGPDGKIVNDIPGATLDARPDGAGGYEWSGTLPPGTFTLKLTGTADGSVHVHTAVHDRAADYPPVTVAKGSVALLTLSDEGAPQSLRLDNGRQIGPSAAAVALKVVRRTTFRKITHFPYGDEAQQINAVKISADGSRIVFSSQKGIFILNPDGSGLKRIIDRQARFVDISRDGKTIAWYDGGPDGGVFIAPAEGGAPKRLFSGFSVDGLRMTADGSKLFVLSSGKGGVVTISDGSDAKVVVATAAVCKLLGVEENAGTQMRTFDISDDGSRIVLHLLWDVFTADGDGSNLRRLTHLNPYELAGLAVSGDGKKVAYFRDSGPTSAMVLSDFDGGNEVKIARPNDHAPNIRFAPDGSSLASSYGVHLYGADGKSFYNATDIGANLWSAKNLSMTADMRHGAFLIDGGESTDQGRPSQIMLVDFNPTDLNGVPTIDDVTASAGFVIDGSAAITVTVRTNAPDAQSVSAIVMRKGERITDVTNGWSLRDDGQGGDSKAGDGVFTTNDLSVRSFHPDRPAAPGPLVVRIHVQDRDGNVTVVDVEGLELRKP